MTQPAREPLPRALTRSNVGSLASSRYERFVMRWRQRELNPLTERLIDGVDLDFGNFNNTKSQVDFPDFTKMFG